MRGSSSEAGMLLQPARSVSEPCDPLGSSGVVTEVQAWNLEACLKSEAKLS